jgi:site-specific DNA-methyltransferase (adenine-specific)
VNDDTRRVMFSAATGDHETPDDLFDQLDAEFHFGLDAAANEANHKVGRWLGPGGLAPDALAPDANWRVLAMGKPVWLNPPYGRDLGRWITKVAEEVVLHGATVVMLLPARTDTKWFHDLVWRGAEIRFLEGRVRFKGSTAGAPFPSLIAVLRPQAGGRYRWRVMR